MILGIGVDIIEISRIKKIQKDNSNFINRIFTEKEVQYFNTRNMNPEVIAGNFASKEAISKALGTGIRRFSFKDIEILRNSLGKPIVNLYNEANIIAKQLLTKEFLNYKIHLSISHNNENAIAYAILEGDAYEDR